MKKIILIFLLLTVAANAHFTGFDSTDATDGTWIGAGAYADIRATPFTSDGNGAVDSIWAYFHTTMTNRHVILALYNFSTRAFICSTTITLADTGVVFRSGAALPIGQTISNGTQYIIIIRGTETDDAFFIWRNSGSDSLKSTSDDLTTWPKPITLTHIATGFNIMGGVSYSPSNTSDLAVVRPLSATVDSSNTSTGTYGVSCVSWDLIPNGSDWATISNNQYMVVLNAGDDATYLGTDFNGFFTGDLDTTLTGDSIKIIVEGHLVGTATQIDVALDTAVSNCAFTTYQTFNFKTTDTTVTFTGDATDWGMSMSPAWWNRAEAGIQIRASTSESGDSLYLDYVALVFYASSGTAIVVDSASASGTGWSNPTCAKSENDSLSKVYKDTAKLAVWDWNFEGYTGYNVRDRLDSLKAEVNGHGASATVSERRGLIALSDGRAGTNHYNLMSSYRGITLPRTTDAYVGYTGTPTAWGWASLNVAKICSTNFGVVFKDSVLQDTLAVDNFRLTAYISHIPDTVSAVHIDSVKSDSSGQKDLMNIGYTCPSDTIGDTVIVVTSTTGYPTDSTLAVSDSVKHVAYSNGSTLHTAVTLSIVETGTAYATVWIKKNTSGTWSAHKHASKVFTGCAPSPLVELHIDSFKNYTASPDTIKIDYITGSQTCPAKILLAFRGLTGCPDSTESDSLWLTYEPYDTVSIYRVFNGAETYTYCVKAWVVFSTEWSTATEAIKIFTDTTAGVFDPRVVTWLDKRAKSLSWIPDEDTLGHTSPDSSNLVDWHPWFNFVNKCDSAGTPVNLTAAGGDSVIIRIRRGATDIFYIRDTITLAYNARSKMYVYPSDTLYNGKSIVLQGGSPVASYQYSYNYRIFLKDASRATTETLNTCFFKGVIPDQIDTVYPGFRNYAPLWSDLIHSTIPANAYTVTVPFPTGWGETIDTFGINNSASPYITSYGGFSYFTWQRTIDSLDETYHAVAKRSDSVGVWSAPTNLMHSIEKDVLHFNSKLIVGPDKRLYYFRGGHTSQGMFAYTKYPHNDTTGICIDDTAWTFTHWGKVASAGTNYLKVDGQHFPTPNGLVGYSVYIVNGTGSTWSGPTGATLFNVVKTIDGNDGDSIHLTTNWAPYSAFDSIPDTSTTYEISLMPTAWRYMTYPEFRMSNNHLFAVYRNTNVVDSIASQYPYAFSVLDTITHTWSGNRNVVNYSERGGTVVYGSSYIIPGSSRMHMAVTLWDDYMGTNKGRATAYLYSDFDPAYADSGYFYKWYQLEQSDSVGVTRGDLRDDSLSDNMPAAAIQYSDLHKIATCEAVDSTAIQPPYWISNHEGSMNVDRYNKPIISFAPYWGTTHQNDTVPAVTFRYDATWGEWIGISLGGDTRFRARAAGDKNAYTVHIDSGTTAGTIKVILKNHVGVADTTETFDNIATYGELYESINHGVATINSGDSSVLMTVAWVGYTLPPVTAEDTLKYGGGSVHSSTVILNPDEQFAWTHHRAGFFIAERENDRMFCYNIFKPQGLQYFGGELVRYRFNNISQNRFPSITKTIMTNESGGGITQQTVVPEVAYQRQGNIDKYTPNYKEILKAQGRSVYHIPDKYIVNNPDGRDVRVYTGTIDSLNDVETFTEKCRVVENSFGLEESKISYRAGVAIDQATQAPRFSVTLIASGNDTITEAAPDTLSRVYLNAQFNYDGFEGYANKTNMDSTSGAWAVVGDSARVWDAQDITQGGGAAPEYAYQGGKYLKVYNAEVIRSASSVSDIDVSVYCGPDSGMSYLKLTAERTSSSDSIDTATIAVGLAFSENRVYIKRDTMTYVDTITVDSTKAPQTMAGDSWINPDSAKASDNKYAKKVGSGTIKYLIGTKVLNFLPDSTYNDTGNVDLNWVVKGITITVEGHVDTFGTEARSKAFFVSLFRNGATIGTARLCTLKYVTDTTRTIGSDTSTWGAGLTYADMLDSTFGVGIYHTAYSDTINIDYITVEAYVQATNVGEKQTGAWVNTNKKVSLFKGFTTNYHRLQFKVINDSARTYVDGRYIGKYKFGTFNHISLGNDKQATDFGYAHFDVLILRKTLAIEPTFHITRTAEQILGSEESSANYARRIKGNYYK